MSTLTDCKGLDVVEAATGAGGVALTDNFKALADRAPYVSSSDPTGGNDSSAGFAVGDQWLNTFTQVMWGCVDASTGAAVWKSLFKRTATALQLIPEESGDEVDIAGDVQVSGYLTAANLISEGSLTLPNSGTGGPTTTGHGLYIKDNGGTARLTLYRASGNALRLDNGGVYGTNIDLRGNAHLFIIDAGTNVERARLTVDGKLGLGTTAPAARLHSTASTILGAASSANGDSDLGNNQGNIWVDESNDLLMFKVKYSNGTVKSGSVALS